MRRFPWYDRAGKKALGIAIGSFRAGGENPTARRAYIVTIRDTKHGR